MLIILFYIFVDQAYFYEKNPTPFDLSIICDLALLQ